MTYDFPGLVKKRVPYVPRVSTAQKPQESRVVDDRITGHEAFKKISRVSTISNSGHDGHAGTPANVHDTAPVNPSNHWGLEGSGHDGHVGHAIIDEDNNAADTNKQIREKNCEIFQNLIAFLKNAEDIAKKKSRTQKDQSSADFNLKIMLKSMSMPR